MELTEEQAKSMGLKLLSNGNYGLNPDHVHKPLKGGMLMGVYAWYVGDTKMVPIGEEHRIIAQPDNIINPGFENQLEGFVFDKVLEDGSIKYIKIKN